MSVSKINFMRPDDLTFVLNQINQIADQYPNRKPHSFVYGGYVRDLIRGVPFHDMDICVPYLEMAEGFIETMKSSQRLLSLETRTYDENNPGGDDYKHFTLTIQTPRTPELQIDISYASATILGENSVLCCDITANNLMMDHTGSISTRVKAATIGCGRKYTEAEWTQKCMRDCIEGKIVWMIPNRFSRNLSNVAKTTFMDKMNMRLNKMISKGFVQTEEYLTDFRLLKTQPICSLSASMEAVTCHICQEDYADTTEKPTVVAKCSHHFHHECIKKWIVQQNDVANCPCCRGDIIIYY
jgi:hypothetical protein